MENEERSGVGVEEEEGEVTEMRRYECGGSEEIGRVRGEKEGNEKSNEEKRDI